jgi:lysozyme family protein
MAQLQPALDYLWPNEGGFVVDNGGPTNFGITQTTLDAANKKRPKAGYPKSVRDLTRPQAADIYLNDFLPSCFPSIKSQRVGTLLFDMGVNAGLQESIILMQRAVNACGYTPTLKVDGQMGPNTLAGINGVDADALCTAFQNQRIVHYTYLANANPTVYGPSLKGWINRAHRFPPADPVVATAPAAPADETA